MAKETRTDSSAIKYMHMFRSDVISRLIMKRPEVGHLKEDVGASAG